MRLSASFSGGSEKLNCRKVVSRNEYDSGCSRQRLLIYFPIIRLYDKYGACNQENVHRIYRDSLTKGFLFEPSPSNVSNEFDLMRLIRPFSALYTCWSPMETRPTNPTANCSWTSCSSRFCLWSPHSWTVPSRCSSSCTAEDFCLDRCSQILPVESKSEGDNER